jgi:hypothetical protein
MNIKKIYFALVSIISVAMPAEANNHVFLMLKAGASHYGSVYFGNLAGSGGDENWKIGPIVSFGAGMQTSNSFAVEFLLVYSTHRFDFKQWYNSPINDPRMNIIDITSLGSYAFLSFNGVRFEMIFGIGYSFQRKDELVRKYQEFPLYVVPKDSRSDVSGLFGGAVQIKLNDNIWIMGELNCRMRYYVTPVAEFGLAYFL